jgi:8-oxo-dGTP pyrophosphatase MutT (NUDIX family)
MANIRFKKKDLEKNKGEAVQVVIVNEEGLVCLVSRKHDHSDFGLPGGKVDEGESPREAARRECKEETGITVTNLRLVFAMHRKGRMGHTFIADYKGEINYDKDKEPHVVKWDKMVEATKGSFAYWNKMVTESLKSMGVDLK